MPPAMPGTLGVRGRVWALARVNNLYGRDCQGSISFMPPILHLRILHLRQTVGPHRVESRWRVARTTVFTRRRLDEGMTEAPASQKSALVGVQRSTAWDHHSARNRLVL